MSQRDDAWFEAMFRAHVQDVHRYARRRVAVSDSDDLTAETFATAWRRRLDIADGTELPWLYRTCGFLIANYRRKGVPTPIEFVPELPDDTDPESLAIADDELRRVLAELSPRDRQVLLLNAWEGLQGEELAAVLGISRGGADAALSRARARLREVWAQVQDPLDV
ncbi:MAG: RNA polymerase sigma factor [Actinomycetes bacterium]